MIDELRLKIEKIEDIIDASNKGKRRNIITMKNRHKIKISMKYDKIRRCAIELQSLYKEELNNNLDDCVGLLKSLSPDFYENARLVYVISIKEKELKEERKQKRLNYALSAEDNMYYQKCLSILKSKKDRDLKEQERIML